MTERDKSRKVIILTYVLFMLPPMMWLSASWYAGIWNFSEMLQLVVSAQMIGFVAFFLVVIHLYIKRSINRLKTNELKQKTIADYPKGVFYLALVYCIVGPTVVVYGRDFISNVEWLLAELMGIPLIILFATPFFIELIYAVDLWSTHVPISNDCSDLKLCIQIRPKNG